MAEPSSSSGKLRVVVVPEVGLLFRPALLIRMLSRCPLDRYLRSFAAEELCAISSAGAVPVHLDGELWGKLPVAFRVAPGALNVVC